MTYFYSHKLYNCLRGYCTFYMQNASSPRFSVSAKPRLLHPPPAHVHLPHHSHTAGVSGSYFTHAGLHRPTPPQPQQQPAMQLVKENVSDVAENLRTGHRRNNNNNNNNDDDRCIDLVFGRPSAQRSSTSLVTLPTYIYLPPPSPGIRLLQLKCNFYRLRAVF